MRIVICLREVSGTRLVKNFSGNLINFIKMSKHLIFFAIGNALLITLTYLARKRRRLNNVLLICTTSFLFLSIIETTYRNFFGPRRNYLAGTSTLPGKQIGKTSVINSTMLTYSADTVYRATYTVIADSDKNVVSFNRRVGYLNPGDPSPRIIFFGCSLCFGVGLNDPETLPYRLGKLENMSTLNLGGIGFGINHVFELFLDRFADKDNKGKLFIYLMIPDHVLRASGVDDYCAGPSFRRVGDSLLYAGPLPIPSNKLAYYCSVFGCFSFIGNMVTNVERSNRFKHVPHEEFEKAYLMIRKMDHIAGASGGKFILLFWDKYDYTSTDRNLYHRQKMEDEIERLRKDGVKVIRVSDILDINDPKYYIPNDRHPNAIAYDTIANYLYKVCGVGWAGR
jgi:hypothetical protein